MNPTWAVFTALYEPVGWRNVWEILPKFKHCIIALIHLTGALQITSMWDVVRSFLNRKNYSLILILSFKPHICVKRGCANTGLFQLELNDSWFSSFKFQRHRRGMEIAQVCSLAGFVKVTNALWCCFPTWLHKFGFDYSRRKMTENFCGFFF